MNAPFPVSSFTTVMGRTLGLAALAAAGLAVTPRFARACAECGCGDPTLTVLGSEKPLRYRMRAGAIATLQGQSSGVAADSLEISEQRLDLSVAWAPLERLFVVATVPFIRRDISSTQVGQRHVDGVGDFELRAKAFVWEDRSFSPRHLVALTGGVRFPLAPWARDAAGTPVTPEEQIGNGAISPILGASYAFFHFPWSAYASVEATAPVVHQDWYHPAPSLRATVAAQRHVARFLAFRLGVDARFDGHADEPTETTQAASALIDRTIFAHPGHETGEPAPGDEAAQVHAHDDEHAGGTAVFASGGILVTPLADLVAFAQLQLPVLERLHDGQRNGPVISTGLVYDF
jgi:hypothetical protein